MVGGPVNRGYICSWANNRGCIHNKELCAGPNIPFSKDTASTHEYRTQHSAHTDSLVNCGLSPHAISWSNLCTHLWTGPKGYNRSTLDDECCTIGG